MQNRAESKQGQWTSCQPEIINKYLEHFCEDKGGSLETFIDDFDKQFLKDIEERVAVFRSDDMTTLSIDLKKYQAISQEVVLRFLESN